MPLAPLEACDAKLLLQIARQALTEAVTRRRLESPMPEVPEILKRPQACFVTLTKSGRLRGCIGTLEADRSLVDNVAHYARAAALDDPRFPPVQAEEVAQLLIEISLLTQPEAFEVTSRADLLEKLRPGVDGLWLEEPPRRATFLPQVWKGLPTPAQFVGQLLIKGGWPADYWSSTMRCSRYQAQYFHEPG